MTEKVSGLTQAARALIGLAAIAHLIFTYIQTRALLLLENEICGFIMFAFVLMGLVTLFEATQIRADKRAPMLLTACFAFATTAVSFLLTNIYAEAIRTQRQLDIAVVNRAQTLSHVLATAFAIAGILLVIDFVRGNKKKEETP